MTEHEKRIREALEAGPTEGPFITFGDQVYRATDPDLSHPLASWNTSQFTMEGVSIDALYYAACNPAAIRALLADLDAMRGALEKIAKADNSESGCYYTNRANINIALAALQAQPAAPSEPALLGAIARGWCHPKNSGKEVDADLAAAIASEILAINPAQPAAAGVSDADVWELWLRVCAESDNVSTRVMIANFARAILALRPQSESDEPTDEQIAAGMRELFAGPKPWPSWETTLKRVYQAMSALRPQADSLCFELSAMLGCPPSDTDVVACVSSLLTPRPQAVPMTDEQRAEVFRAAESRMVYDSNLSWRNAIVEGVESHHGITAPAGGVLHAAHQATK